MTRQIGFFLFPRYSLLAVGAATTALSSVNEITGSEEFAPRLLSFTGGDVPARCGSRLLTEPVNSAIRSCSALLLFADHALSADEVHDAHQVLREFLAHAPGDAVVGAAGAATLVLAGCGLIDGTRAAVNWQHATEVAERYPKVVVSTNVFEWDKRRLTCGGGTTVLDALLHWLGESYGAAFVSELGAMLGMDRVRSSDDKQPLPASAQPAVASERIKEALALMEANLGEPLQTQDIAQLIGISRRQLERLFRQHLDALPSRYYLELRLKQARHQLRHTSRSIMQIGLACGFASGPHFSTAYRSFFGHTPREERARRLMPRASVPPNGESDS